MKCLKCGKIINKSYRGMCQTCYNYQRDGGVWYDLPNYGEVKYDNNGKAICHICGMAFDKLIEHTKRKHGLTSEEYRKEFGLMGIKSTHLVSPIYMDKMQKHAIKNQTHKENFESVHNGEKRYVDGRKPNSWSQEEKNKRQPIQVANSRIRFE